MATLKGSRYNRGKMQVIPAIDIKNGKCVRLLQGRRDREILYFSDPLEAAQKWVEEGAEIIHLIDLDGAKAGRPENISSLKRIVEEVKIPVQFGGGVRNSSILEEIINLGVKRVILGTAALTNRKFLQSALEQYQENIVLGLDAIGEDIAIEGWEKSSQMNLFTVAKEMEELRAKRILYTDIKRDGMLSGPNLSNIKKLLDLVKIKLIASGGISSLEDIINLKGFEPLGLEGAVVGRALYTGDISLKKAIALGR